MTLAESFWTDERVEILKTKWAEGLTAQQIAIDLGASTRNVVMGKIHRMRLDSPNRRSRVAHNSRSLPARTTARANPEWAKKPKSTWRQMSMVKPRLIGRKTLIDLQQDDCRWPIGNPRDPDFFFCGKHVVEGLPYCAYHCHVAFQPVRALVAGLGGA